MATTFFRILHTAFALLVCAWPVWMYLGVRHLAAPEGFWQEMFLVGIGIWALGSLQVLFLAIAIVWVLFVWDL